MQLWLRLLRPHTGSSLYVPCLPDRRLAAVLEWTFLHVCFIGGLWLSCFLIRYLLPSNFCIIYCYYILILLLLISFTVVASSSEEIIRKAWEDIVVLGFENIALHLWCLAEICSPAVRITYPKRSDKNREVRMFPELRELFYFFSHLYVISWEEKTDKQTKGWWQRERKRYCAVRHVGFSAEVLT